MDPFGGIVNSVPEVVPDDATLTQIVVTRMGPLRVQRHLKCRRQTVFWQQISHASVEGMTGTRLHKSQILLEHLAGTVFRKHPQQDDLLGNKLRRQVLLAKIVQALS